MDPGSEDDNEDDFEGFVALNDEHDECTEITDIPNDGTNNNVNSNIRPTISTSSRSSARSSRQANISPEKIHDSRWNEGPLTTKSIPFSSSSKINVDTTAFDVVKFYELFLMHKLPIN